MRTEEEMTMLLQLWDGGLRHVATGDSLRYLEVPRSRFPLSRFRS